MRNNLFNFATRELSQDAMICWLSEHFHHKLDNEKLYDLSIIFIQLVSRLDFEDTHVKVIRQY